ncbi:MAG: YggS family pyridoxal phosphate-dependent enzyme [Candidatus Caenarcaniphilales bacterium]|nr:YggS family pyridoxal phosphate-dependent enzyme [Candidatus Caenarcaniphilales bacterium]
MTADALARRLQLIRSQIPDAVKLIAVSKTFPAPRIVEAHKLGLTDFGENKVQETNLKRQDLQTIPGLKWHLIGHLQSNKLKQALRLFDYIHSVDREDLLERLSEFQSQGEFLPKLLLQVKLLPDPYKHGMSIAQAYKFSQSFAKLPICGLMTILPQQTVGEEAYLTFKNLRALADELKLPECSMGMSGDYREAVRAGSTMVRIGQALFGARE